MNRLSIHFKPNGLVNSIRMTSRFFGIPLFKVNAFFVDGLLIDTGFILGRDRFLKEFSAKVEELWKKHLQKP